MVAGDHRGQRTAREAVFAVALTAQQAAVHDRGVATAASSSDEVPIITSADEAAQPADAIVGLFVRLNDDRVVSGLDQAPLTA